MTRHIISLKPFLWQAIGWAYGPRLRIHILTGETKVGYYTHSLESDRDGNVHITGYMFGWAWHGNSVLGVNPYINWPGRINNLKDLLRGFLHFIFVWTSNLTNQFTVVFLLKTNWLLTYQSIAPSWCHNYRYSTHSERAICFFPLYWRLFSIAPILKWIIHHNGRNIVGSAQRKP